LYGARTRDIDRWIGYSMLLFRRQTSLAPNKMDRWSCNIKYAMIWNETSVAYFKVACGIWLEGPRKITKYSWYSSWWPCASRTLCWYFFVSVKC
jgi:hypothetical protein